MAECIDSLSNSMASLSASTGDTDVDKHLKELGLDNSIRAKLLQIENMYESIFSWEVKKLTGSNQNLMLNLIDKIKEKCEMVLDKENVFNLNRFYFQLIICYELYFNKSYEESLLEIENIVKSLETCTFDESNEQYLDAYNHIARATNAYIAITLNLESEKIVRSIKKKNNLNCAEKAAICAVKAKVFMEYAPKGNEIALKFSKQARNLHSTEPEWIIIWLKAKGRVRRYYNSSNIMPEKDEIDAAEMLSTTKTKYNHLVYASKIFMEVAFHNKINKKFKESDKYYKLSSDILQKTIELTNDNIEVLESCLNVYVNIPIQFHTKTVIDQIIQKLTHVQNSQVDFILGKYYLKYEKDYEKAKIYLSHGMAAGNFNSALQLLKVDCILQPFNFPIVKTLNMIYSVFTSPQRRLIVLSQILIYYYYENNPKELMHYLKLYLEQEVDDTLKKKYLITAYPIFKINEFFNMKQFLNALSTEVNNLIKLHDWKKEEKKIVESTVDRFNIMIKAQLYENQHVEDKKKYDSKNLFHDKSKNWQNQRVCFSSKNYNDLNKNKNHQYPSASKNIGQNKKNAAFNKELPAHKSIKNGKSSNSFQLGISVNDLNCIDSKKFEKQYSSSENFHVVSVKNKSTFKSADDNCNGRVRHKQNWQSQRDKSLI